MQVEKYSACVCVCVKTKSDIHSSMQNDISAQKEQQNTQVQTFHDHLLSSVSFFETACVLPKMWAKTVTVENKSK